MSNGLTALTARESEEHWVTISDMMAGLMMIFLFISVAYMIHVISDRDEIRDIAITYQKMQTELYNDLDKEFHDDLIQWNAELDRATLSVRFREPDVLFEPARVEVRSAFQEILDDFFPRYIGILMSTKYINDIEEVRIEGHTSSEWMGVADKDIAYFKNMELSQGRTRSVLQYVFSIPQITKVVDVRSWLRKYLTANGLSSSKLRCYPDGLENRLESRRVEFRVRTKAEERIFRIIEARRQ